MLRIIIFAAVCIGAIMLYEMGSTDTGTVYGCHEKDLKKEVELECRHIRMFDRPKMEGGCVYQESHGQVIKTCG